MKKMIGIVFCSIAIFLLLAKVIGQWPDTASNSLKDWVVVGILFTVAFVLLAVGIPLALKVSEPKDIETNGDPREYLIFKN